MDKILIEVACPATSKKYDFWVSKKLPVGKVQEKLIQEIRGFEKSNALFCDGDDIFLYSCSGQQVLAQGLTVEQAGIRSGDCLMML